MKKRDKAREAQRAVRSAKDRRKHVANLALAVKRARRRSNITLYPERRPDPFDGLAMGMAAALLGASFLRRPIAASPTSEKETP